MKKTVTTLLVVATVFLCSQFPVFADGTAPGKTITTSNISYSDGNVTLFARVNGRYSGDEGYPSSTASPHAKYQHTFEIVLANNTNEFQVASTNMFSLMLFSGSTDVFNASASGSTQYHAGWGASVDYYSDNMSAPEVTFYRTGDYAGNVYIRFYDNDLLVLNPNETRIYSFTITFTQDLSTNYVYLNGNSLYSYFTYSGSVSFYSRPNSFTSNTIDDFISNESLPNSVIAYFQYLLEQGEEEQAVLDNIYSYLQIHYPYQSSTLTNQTYRPNNNTLNYDIMENDVAVGRIYSEVSQYSPYLVSGDHNIFNFDTTNVNYEEQSIICVPVRYHLRVRNLSQSDSYSLSQSYIEYRGKPSFNVDSGYYAGSDIQIMENDGLILQSITNTGFLFGITDYYNGNPIMYAQDYKYITVMEYRYFVVDRIYDTTNIVNIRHSVTGYTFPSSNVFYNTITATNNNVGWWKNNTNILNSIKDKLQQLLDSGNYGVNDNLNDQSADNQSQEDAIHAQEQQWYQDNETAITAVGLSNYEFSGDQTSGLSGVSSQFTAVWNALDGWTNIYIFVLTLSLASFILRHNPFTRRQQNYSDRPKGEST